jgi:hypothetical protein
MLLETVVVTLVHLCMQEWMPVQEVPELTVEFTDRTDVDE